MLIGSSNTIEAKTQCCTLLAVFRPYLYRYQKLTAQTIEWINFFSNFLFQNTDWWDLSLQARWFCQRYVKTHFTTDFRFSVVILFFNSWKIPTKSVVIGCIFTTDFFLRFQKMGCFGFWRVSVIMYWNRLHERNATDFSFSVLKSGLTYLLLVYRSKRLWNNEFWIISSAAPSAEIYQKFAF